MPIPKIIHQTWKHNRVPGRWKPLVKKVKELNPGWEYKLWTDADNDAFVRREFPEFYPVYRDFPKAIMRADVIRYLLMYKTGGVYLDLDYEVLRSFEFGDHEIILPKNRSLQYGDPQDELGNCFFASAPGHPFWLEAISDLQNNPPVVMNYTEVVEATGPRLLTRIYRRTAFENMYTPERLLYHPPSTRKKKDAERIKRNGISLGIHHTWGSWKERGSWLYWKIKFMRFSKKI